jgi:colanic acid biosynthesis glycosyl transferase WcaI
MPGKRPSIAILYHFFPPDDVVSAALFGDLSAGLVERGWDVTAFPCLWSCHLDGARYPSSEEWKEVKVRRLWRPRFRQTSGIGRLCNAAWMITRWSMLSLTARPRPDILIVGTDPVLSVLVAPTWRRLSRRTAIAHWCFDLYPEAAIADGLMAQDGKAAKILKRWLGKAYKACALIADLGPCMRRLLLTYPSDAERETIVPWALEEAATPLPICVPERKILFGDAPLALLYSGSFGRAHSYEDLLDLAERIEGHGGRIVFSVRGNREAELRTAARKRNIEIPFVPFADKNSLTDRLACADVHVVSLHSEWTGTVLPSKFFGALSAGRPVLFAGSYESSIAVWIRQYQVGWVLNSDNMECVATQLIEYAHSPQLKAEMQQRCSEVYHAQFSRRIQMDHWDERLRSILNKSRSSGIG